MPLEVRKTCSCLVYFLNIVFILSSIKAKKIIDSGEISPIKIIFDYGLDPGEINGRGKTPNWAQTKDEGGGVFFDTIHSVDKLRYWMKSEVLMVYVPIMDTLQDSAKVEQMGIANLIFSNGAVAVLMPVSPTWGVRDIGTKMIGKKGALYVTYGEEVKVGKKNWKNYRFEHQSIPASYEHNLKGFANELSEFVASIKENRQPNVTGEEGKRNLRVVLKMYDSFKKRKMVYV